MKKDITKFCKSAGITEDQFYGKEKISGDLYLRSVTSLPDGFNPTVGGDLYLRSVTSLPDGFNPTVGGDLYLRSVTSLPDGFNPTVGGDLYLRSVTSLPDGFNPTVGGDLYLRSVTSLPDGFNPTVGGDLYLRSVTSLPDGFNPTVGGDLIWKNGRKHIGAQVPPKPKVEVSRNFFWENEKGKFAIVDGIFCEILNHKRDILKGQEVNVYSAKKIGKPDTFFIVGSNNRYAHGLDLKKAYSDLEFKIISEKLKSQPINADTELDIKHYRLITGACDMGCRSFLESNNLPFKVIDDETVFVDKQGNPSKIKAKDLLPLLEKNNAYGLSKFKQMVTF